MLNSKSMEEKKSNIKKLEFIVFVLALVFSVLLYLALNDKPKSDQNGVTGLDVVVEQEAIDDLTAPNVSEEPAIDQDIIDSLSAPN